MDKDFAEMAKDTLERFMDAFMSKEVAFAKFAEWLSKEGKRRGDKAIWVYLDRTGGHWNNDYGFSVEIYEWKRGKFSMMFGGLIGKKTAGLEVKVPVYQYGPGRFFIGVGAVKEFAHLDRPLSPTFSFSARFK
jgi:hypothetical protein